MPNGRCNNHGGKSLAGVDSPQYIHGRYSKTLPAQIRAKVETDDSDPLDLLPELQVQRALLSEYINRYGQPGAFLPQDAINAMIVWANDIGKMVERIVKMRNESALTKAEVAFIVARIPEIVARFVDDPVKQQEFVSQLFGITGHREASLSELTGGTAAHDAGEG